MRVVIIGGVAGGASAAARIRRLDESAKIIILERTGFVSYANCGLPYYVGGVITDPGELTVQTPEGFAERFRIEVRVRHEAIAIHPDEHIVLVRDLDSGREYAQAYDRLLLSPGAHPLRTNLPGEDNSRVFTLRTVEDTLRMRGFVEQNKPKTAVIAGGGYIGLEMAENLANMGLQVTIVQRSNQVMPPLDHDMAALVHGKLRNKGIDLRLNAQVTGFAMDGDMVNTHINGCEPVSADMVLLAVGVRPEAELAKAAGLRVGFAGSIYVNEYMQTSHPDIYAVGDAVAVRHFVLDTEAFVPLAGPANKQGRIAADNICGSSRKFTGTQGTSILKLFDMVIATTGINEKMAKAAALSYERVILSPAFHASYYPGGGIITIKLIWERGTMRILGAQIIGQAGVDKRIDVIATAMRGNIRADELKDLELAYAPPFSSAKDPVNMAGFMVDNIARGLVKQFHWDEMGRLPRDGSVQLLDTRTEREYARGHVDGFINIPLDALRERLDDLDKNKPVYVMCHSGLRSYFACRILMQNGFVCHNFSGGYRFYAAIHQEQQMAASAFPCGMDR